MATPYRVPAYDHLVYMLLNQDPDLSVGEARRHAGIIRAQTLSQRLNMLGGIVPYNLVYPPSGHRQPQNVLQPSVSARQLNPLAAIFVPPARSTQPINKTTVQNNPQPNRSHFSSVNGLNSQAVLETLSTGIALPFEDPRITDDGIEFSHNEGAMEYSQDELDSLLSGRVRHAHGQLVSALDLDQAGQAGQATDLDTFTPTSTFRVQGLGRRSDFAEDQAVAQREATSFSTGEFQDENDNLRSTRARLPPATSTTEDAPEEYFWSKDDVYSNPPSPTTSEKATAAAERNADLYPDVPSLTDAENAETLESFIQRLRRALQMMFVSGETAEPSTETTGMIEELVREQVIEMLTQATTLANRRGTRSITTSDLIFLIRHDKAKVSRLKTFLSWKDVRKNVKDSDDKGGADAGDAGFDVEDGGNMQGAGPSDSKKAGPANKKAKLILPWEVQSFYSESVPEREDEEDNEEEEEQNEATLARLASADERTRNMTRDEYVFWSDCRQASFTFRKGKRFREWAGFGVVTDSKPNDDIVDILGFLTFEIVQTLTEEALKVKAAEDQYNAKNAGLGSGGEAAKKRKHALAGEGGGLFEMPEEGKTPVEPKHVREAYRRLQVVPNKYKFMRQGYAGIKTGIRLI